MSAVFDGKRYPYTRGLRIPREDVGRKAAGAAPAARRTGKVSKRVVSMYVEKRNRRTRGQETAAVWQDSRSGTSHRFLRTRCASSETIPLDPLDLAHPLSSAETPCALETRRLSTF